MANIDFVSDTDGDWICMYVDGELVGEGHSFSPHHMFRYLIGQTVEKVEYFEVSFEDTGLERGHAKLNDYKFKK